jgi:hypothetical protein
MKHMLVGLILIALGSSCVKTKVVEVPTPVETIREVPVMVYVPVEVGATEPDSLPIEYTQKAFWDLWWDLHWLEYNGATFCYGKNSSFTTINPHINQEKLLRTYKHEMVHVNQARIWGCQLLKERSADPTSLAKVEIEAYNGEGMINPDTLLSRLMTYELVATMGADSVLKIIKVNNGNVRW